jgi:hypothetical protein
MRAIVKPRVRIACIIAGLLLTLTAVAQDQSRLVAVGDAHGAYPELVSILQKTGLIDGKHAWAGGRTTLVQTGDILDRGSQVRDCLDLMMALERQAPKAGGKVIALLGNHETINLMGDVRYVTADIFRAFADSRSEARREAAYRDYLKFFSRHRDHMHAATPVDGETAKQKWMVQHPPGFIEYRDALSAQGKYGAWIRSHRAIAKIGDGVFMHAGLNPTLQFRDIEELNNRIRAELAAFDSIWQSLVRRKIIWRYMTLEEATRQAAEELKWLQAQENKPSAETLQQIQLLLDRSGWLVANLNGPLWYRGLAQEPEDKLAGDLKGMLIRLGARYIVSGHTVVSKSSVTARFDNQVFLIDVGMLKEVYGGRAAALEIQDGRITALYTDGESKILVEK